MPRKKKEETEETIAEPTEGGKEEAPIQASADESTPEVAAAADAGKDKPRKSAKTSAAEDADVEGSGFDEIADAAGDALDIVATAVGKGAADIVSSVTGATSADKGRKFGKRAEKVGIVSSDKMMKTVTVRVDRLVKHPVYRKYVKRRKKFMAHDDLGAKVGDRVKIVETRPMSARKRWRVVEIIQRAEL
jgi:small subunit ribosomal protein S17